MIHFNLLPWREQQREHQAQILKRMLYAAIVFSVVFIVSVHFILDNRLSELHNQAVNLQQQSTIWHAEVNQLEAEQNDISKIKRIKFSNAAIKQLFSALNITYPSICFLEVVHTEKTFNFQGQARSTWDLLDYLQHLRTAGRFSHITVDKLLLEKNNMVRFKFSAN